MQSRAVCFKHNYVVTIIIIIIAVSISVGGDVVVMFAALVPIANTGFLSAIYITHPSSGERSSPLYSITLVMFTAPSS